MNVAIRSAEGLLLLALCVPPRSVYPQSIPVDFGKWTAESYPAVSGFAPGDWDPGEDGVFQSANGQPTLFYSDFAAFNTSFEGRIKVEGGDDDYIGFVLGFNPGDTDNPNADYLLVDWRAGRQPYDFPAPSCTPASTAERGLAVSRVFGLPTADEFWGHTNFDSPACSDLSSGLEALARGVNLGDKGWVAQQDYRFRFDFTANSLKVFVDDGLELEIAGSFKNGKLGFYNFSQPSVRYSGFTVEFLPTRFRRGDANADANRDTSDAIFVLNCLFADGACPTCDDAADSNDDGALNVADPVYLLGFLFLGGPPPPDPSGQCGVDPTDDNLTCESFEPCR